MECPVCRAENEAPAACRRCKADLSILWNLASVRRQRLKQMRAAVLRLDFDAAETALSQAESIARDVETTRLRAMLSLLQGSFVEAWRQYQTATAF
jgi:hypothetical protein